MFKKSPLSKKFIKKQKRFFLIKIIFFFILLTSFVFLISFFSKLENISISTISVSGAKVLDTNEVISFAKEELQGNYFFLFSKKNIFFYPKKTIKERLKDTWKRIETVDIERKGLTAIEITITERKPKFLWCRDEMPRLSEGKECYFMDESGFIFSKAPEFSENVYFRFFGAIKNENSIGKVYAGVETFKNLSSFILMLDKAKINATGLITKENKEYELYLTDGSRILFSEKQDMTETFENLKAFLKSAVFKKELTQSFSSLDYIDLRYGNKVFYKFK